MALGNITSANAAVILTVDTLFPSGITLEQFATDQSVTQDEVTLSETRMGVDGHMAAGFKPSVKPVTLMLEASSPSRAALDQVVRAMEQNMTTYECTLVARVPSLGVTYTWTGGVLKSGSIFPGLKAVLDATTWKFDFAEMKVSSI